MMTVQKKYTQEDETLARYAKALGHPARLAIVRFLAQNDACFAGNIADMLPIAPSTVSQHLNALKAAGLITGNINPPTIQYCIHPEAWAEAQKLFGLLFEQPIRTGKICK